MQNYRTAILLVISVLLTGCQVVQEQADPRPLRILFIGNSITHHGPAPSLGWFGDWGMAASSADKDYVHLTASTLQADFRDINLPWEGAYNNFDYSQLDPYLNWADIVVIEFGENVATTSPNFPSDLVAGTAQLVQHAGQGKPTYVISSWWPYSPIDDAMKQGAEQAGATFVMLPSYDPTVVYASQFADPGVAIHPNDSGMRLIAGALLASISHYRRFELTGCESSAGCWANR